MKKPTEKSKDTIAKLKAKLKDVSNKLVDEQKKSRYLESIIASMPGHIYWMDKDGRILGCNDEQARDVGCASRLDVIGKTIHDFKPKEEADKILANNNEIMSSGLSKLIEEVCNLVNGDEKTFLSHKAPLKDDKGNIIGVLGISTDITALKDNEFTLENIIALMPGNIYWMDKNHVFLGCNNNQLKTLGLRSRADFIGQTYDGLLEPNDTEKVRKVNSKVVETGKPQSLEELGLDEFGNKAIYLTTKSPLRNNNGKVIGMVGVSVDITDLKEIERELEEAKEKAEAANQAKTEFMLNMQHDLRTPASGIFGLAKILAEATKEKRDKEYLTLITTASEELLNILNDILRFHLIESGTLSVLMKKIDVYSLVERIIKLESASAKNKELLLESHLASNVPKIIISDEYRIHRLLLNLVSNATKFTKKGFVKLIVGVGKKIDKENIMLRFIVRDTGIGIPKEKQDVIYERFQKLTLSNTGRYKGLGLGLRIVKKFTEELGGSIEVESKVGKGTTFICTLPVKTVK